MSAGGFFGNTCDQFAIPISIGDYGVAADANGREMWPGFFRSSTPGFVTKVRVRFTNFAHQYPDDVNILLTKCDPIQQRVRSCVLMANAGGTSVNHLDGINFTIDDDGATMPDQTPKMANGGVYKPGCYGTVGDPQSDPKFWQYWMQFYTAVPRPQNDLYAKTLSEFIGAPAWGCWAIWIVDDHGLDAGSIGNIELLIDAA